MESPPANDTTGEDALAESKAESKKLPKPRERSPPPNPGPAAQPRWKEGRGELRAEGGPRGARLRATGGDRVDQPWRMCFFKRGWSRSPAGRERSGLPGVPVPNPRVRGRPHVVAVSSASTALEGRRRRGLVACVVRATQTPALRTLGTRKRRPRRARRP